MITTRPESLAPTTAVIFGFLAVVGKPNVPVLVLIQCGSRGGRQGNAFVSWAEEHEVFSFGLCEYRSIKTPESGHHVACVFDG